MTVNASLGEDGGRLEARHRLICRARLADSRQMETHVRTETRTCGDECSSVGETGEGAWWNRTCEYQANEMFRDGNMTDDLSDMKPLRNVFYNYCECKDLGIYKICRKCNS